MSLPKNISIERFNSTLGTKNVPNKLRSREFFLSIAEANAQRCTSNSEGEGGSAAPSGDTKFDSASPTLLATRKGLRVPPLSHCGDHFEFDRDRRGQGRDLNRRACRIGFARSGKMLRVESVVGRKIFLHVREEDRNIDNVVPGRAGVFQDEPDIFEHGAALFLDVIAGHVASGVECDARDFFAAAHARTDPGKK